MFRPKSQLSQEFTDDWVSVVIPTYNRAKMLSEALESVRQQTYRPIEIIIVDDGSTDSTRAMVEAFSNEYSSADFKLKYFYQLNRNASACRNLGLLNSVGEFIQFLDSDDCLHPYKLREPSRKITRLETGTLFGHLPLCLSKRLTGLPVSTLGIR